MVIPFGFVPVTAADSVGAMSILTGFRPPDLVTSHILQLLSLFSFAKVHILQDQDVSLNSCSSIEYGVGFAGSDFENSFAMSVSLWKVI